MHKALIIITIFKEGHEGLDSAGVTSQIVSADTSDELTKIVENAMDLKSRYIDVVAKVLC